MSCVPLPWCTSMSTIAIRCAPASLRGAHGDRRIVEEAETHWQIWCCVVSRRAHDRERGERLALHQRTSRARCARCGVERHGVGVLGRIRVGVEPSSALHRHPFHATDLVVGMHEQRQLAPAGRRVEPRKRRKHRVRGDPIEDRDHAIRAFGMPVASMLELVVVANQRQGTVTPVKLRPGRPRYAHAAHAQPTPVPPAQPRCLD